MDHHNPLDTCVSSGWSPTLASAPESAVAAVLAGFVFMGIVATLSTRTKEHDSTAQALKLLLAAFLGLAVTSYLFGHNAGVQPCKQAATLVVVAGGPLGTFSIIMLASLTWLVAAYQDELKDVLKLLRRLIYVSAALVVLLLCTSSQKYVSEELGQSGPVRLVVISSAIYGIGIVGILVGLSALMLGHTPNKIDWSSRVDNCFYAALCYLGAVGVWAAIVVGIPRRLYYPIHPLFIYFNAFAALFAPIPVFIFAALALARTQARKMPNPKASNGDGTPSASTTEPAS